MAMWDNWFKPKVVVGRDNEYDQARDLINALDRGGLPLNPSRINEIARNLGLEVSRQAPQEQTIERIRAALKRHHEN